MYYRLIHRLSTTYPHTYPHFLWITSIHLWKSELLPLKLLRFLKSCASKNPTPFSSAWARINFFVTDFWPRTYETKPNKTNSLKVITAYMFFLIRHQNFSSLEHAQVFPLKLTLHSQLLSSLAAVPTGARAGRQSCLVVSQILTDSDVLWFKFPRSSLTMTQQSKWPSYNSISL